MLFKDFTAAKVLYFFDMSKKKVKNFEFLLKKETFSGLKEMVYAQSKG